MIRKRIEFAQKYSSKTKDFWDRVVYADEAYIEINPGAIMNRVRRFSSTNPYASSVTKKSLKYPTKIMIWGCFNARGFGRIKVCEGSMTSQKYLEVLNSHLKPTIQDLGIQNAIYLDDSARPHRTKPIKEWMQSEGIESIEWPGNSPDLNPIENLWAILKSKLRKQAIPSKRELIEKIIQTWFNSIDPSIL